MKQRLWSQFRDLKLRTKFLISFVIIISLSLTLSSIIHYYASSNAIETMTSQSSALLLDQVALNFEQKIQDVEDASFQEYSNSAFCEIVTDKDQDTYKDLLKVQLMKQFLYRMVYKYEMFPYAAIYTGDGENYKQFRLGTSINPILAQFELTDQEALSLDAKRGQTIWSQGDEKLLFVKRAMYDLETSAFCGTLVLGVESDYFKSIYPSTDESGEIMFANQQDELLIYNSESSAALFEASEKGKQSEFELDANKYITIENKTDDGRWTLINIISFEQFTSYMKTIQNWVVVTFCIAFVAAFLNAAILARSITKKLYILVNSMKTLSIGALDTVIRINSRDEIGVIAEKFNLMGTKIKELIQTASHEKVQKERAVYKQLEFEYKALQAQMNPHFLYNTLESIHSLAKIKGQEEIGHSIYLLGKLIRESINRKEDFVALREEIEFVQGYLTLQGITYESGLQVAYELDEFSLDWTVPRFILQPIVENSIVHGIEKKSGIGRIAIRCSLEDADLKIEVEDNGVGMTEELIRKLIHENTDTAPTEPHRTGVGVKSVHKRLQLLFGPSYGVSISSEPGIGSKIIITLPKTRREDMIIGNESNHR
ncbi:sensor histidine kinase [Paenibacillus sp. strain BS8-2]